MKMKKGFTILELLVVISVLVILIGIAIPRFKGMQDAGRVAQARAELKTLQTAVESYYMNNSNTYPADSTTPGATLSSQAPKIVAGAMIDPFSSSSAEYKYELTTPYYVIASVGASQVSLASLAIDSQGEVTIPAGGICVTNGNTSDCD
jgi:prepilin-type N-terminal cleavage/methylation domain-containing protein